MKGVILAGGTGSRLHPFTKFLNKHLLPVGPYPMIYWSIMKLRDAGIDDILIITNKHHLSSFIELLGLGEELQVNIQYQIQSNVGGGIADALISAKDFTNSKNLLLYWEIIYLKIHYVHLSKHFKNRNQGQECS